MLSWQITLMWDHVKMFVSGSLVRFKFKEAKSIGIILGDSEKSKQMHRVLYDNKVGHFFKKQLKIIKGD